MYKNEDYGQQVTSLFDMLKLAPPDQLQTLAQSVEQNPNSPEATALAMATQYQQQASSQQQQAPTQTIFQQKIAQLQQRMNPMQGGITDVGANQYAQQDAAQQDPMRNAGIGAAPENAEAPQGAATGGLVALAQGGAIRHFFGGGNTTNPFAPQEIPELGTEEYPEEEEELEPADPEMYEAAQTRYANRRAAEADYDADVPESALTAEEEMALPPARLASPKQPKRDTGIVNPPRPGSSAERIQAQHAQNRSLDDDVQDLMGLYGPSYAVSPELQTKFEGQLADANKEKWFNALAQGIGGMLSAQTPHLSQAAGAGLLAGAAGYQQGAKEESDLQKQMLALQLAGEKERHADRRAAVGTITKQIADTAAAKRKQEGQEKLAHIRGQDMIKAAQIVSGGRGANTYATTAEEIGNIAFKRAELFSKDPNSKYFGRGAEEIMKEIMPGILRELAQHGAQFNPNSGGGRPDPGALGSLGLITGGRFLP